MKNEKKSESGTQKILLELKMAQFKHFAKEKER